MARLRAGDGAAFDLAYQRYSARVYGFLMRMVLRRDEAEDLLQETWIRFARAARTLRDDARLAGWLFRVARNLALSRERRRELEEDAAELLVLVGESLPADEPHQAFVAADTRRRLELALAALPARDREVILLVGVDGLEPREAAEALGIKPEALRKRLERAREKTRVLIDAVDLRKVVGS